MHFLSIWRRKIWAFPRWALSSGAFVISMYVPVISPKKLWIRHWIPWNFHADQHKESCNFTWGWLVRPCIAKNVEANPKFRNSEPVVLGCVISGDASSHRFIQPRSVLGKLSLLAWNQQVLLMPKLQQTSGLLSKHGF